MRSRSAQRMVGAAILIGLATGCSAGAADPGTVVLTEWKIQAAPPEGGMLHVRNDGQRQHQLVVSQPGGRVLAVTNLLQPGQSADIVLPERGALELTSRFISVDPDGTVQDDAANGMDLHVDWP